MSAFASRHIGSRDAEREEMLSVVGVKSLDELMDEVLPAGLTRTAIEDLPRAHTEAEILARLQELAGKNTPRTSMIGQGYYDTVTPAVIQRNILENPSWYTAYTPYQPEISQGRLEALVNFQTMVTDLTGMDIAGASMLDEGTAVAEAVLLAGRVQRKRTGVLLLDDVFEATRAVVANRAEAVGMDLREGGIEDLDDNTACVILQYPGASGVIRSRSELEEITTKAHEAGALVIVAADILALTLLAAPGEWGADIVAGSTQRFGVPMGGGGPHAGYLACREKHQRQLPGRLVGVSKDADGNVAYRLALQTREQHIRREKATSNICTAQVLLAVIAQAYAVYHGPEGLTAIANRIHELTASLAAKLAARGIGLTAPGARFDTLEIAVDAKAATAALLERDITAWPVGDGAIRLSVDERTTEDIVDRVVEALAKVAQGDRADEPQIAIGEDLARESDFLTHPTFHRYRTETQLMRYLKYLADKDYALDRGMIPLGSCTMKLNSAVEMAAITWPEFANIHPFAPAADRAGYLELIEELADWLAKITGYDGVSFQPNAGSQGELAGLLAIRGYHRSRGDMDRTICLIPASAHGTNAASAVLAGFKVVVVGTADDGSIDVDDLDAKIAEHGDKLGAIMITYPSTHGTYEDTVGPVCEKVHEAGGQVYIDGANLNALVGVAQPGKFGGDVSHLNLHKTFAIPHGGGGPGVGPVCAREHLVPFLPSHPLRDESEKLGLSSKDAPGSGAVSSAPYGSALILPIPYAYIALMGGEALREATQAAVLAANYVASRLEDNLPVLYRGKDGLVGHECIIDLRPLRAETGITVDDVAKRLIDYGFHAPTMSFPVPGTFMVEPTESEDLAEVSRFCAAMESIVEEARKVKAGEWPKDDNPLVNAPHTAECAIRGEWDHPYSREVAVYPGMEAGEVDGKYWPPVRRIDGPYGDRNLMCSCPPIEDY